MNWLTKSRKSAQYIIVGRISIAIAIFISTFSSVGKAQDTDITNEYRATLVTSRPVADKVVLFQYLGYVTAPDKSVKTIYYSPPGVIYKAKPWLELWVGMFGLYNFNENTANSWELRPLAGVKVYLPNKKKLNIYNFTRFEYRFINQNNETQGIPRIRNRIGIEAPLAKGEKAWTPKTFYALGDVEPIWRLDNDTLQFVRLRAGVGYIFNKTWRAEVIYHTEFSGDPTKYTGNIWRLNIKLNLPRKGSRHTHDIDIE
jgi:Protein of unknown function (DUF2490)